VKQSAPVSDETKKARTRYLLNTQATSSSINPDALYELISYYRELKAKPQPLTGQDSIDEHAIETILKNHGLMLYFSE
jgi:hypothetical protein